MTQSLPGQRLAREPGFTRRAGLQDAVIGAGPYGLSVAAHLRAAGIPVSIFGAVMGSGRHAMVIGLFLPASLAHQADGEVARGGHGARCCAGAASGSVFAVGDVSHVVQGFHEPVVLDEFGQTCGACLFGGDADDGVDGLRLDPAGPVGHAASFGLYGLDGVRETKAARDGAYLEPADLTPSVAGCGGAALQWDLAPGQAFDLFAELLLVALDQKQIVAAGRDDVVGVLALGVHGVGGDAKRAI